ncbi:G-protein coupled receptor 4-like [Hemitrygon akajei]|uniref:G-protein coupled receptor 4-like n=1 Tax=Hemitrygon akajei TaxID=2704970 RepID=UPI003BF94396
MADNLTQAGSSSNCTVDLGEGQYLILGLYAASFFISLPGNCLSIYVACLHVKRENEIGIYLLNLSSVDILYTLTIPFWFYDCLDQHSNILLYNVIVVVTYSSMYLSPAFLCCIAVDRYLAIVYPLRFYELRTIQTAVVVSAVCWAIQLTCHALLLHRLSLFSNFSSSVFREELPMNATLFTENIVRIVFGFFFPLSIFVFSSQRIYRMVANSTSVENEEKKKLARLLLLLLLVYIISFGPYHVTLLARSLVEPGNCPFAQSAYLCYKIFYALTGVNCAADPILYCWLNDTARYDILQLCVAARNRLQRLCSWLKCQKGYPKESPGLSLS